MSDDKKVIYSMIRVGKIVPPIKQILRDISLSYFYGAKIGVLGLNGAGKSTLLRIMAGVDEEYLGETVLAPGFTVGYLEQEPFLDSTKTVREIVEEGAQETVDALRAYVRAFSKAGDVTDVVMTGIDRYGFEMSVAVDGGRRPVRVAFDTEVHTPEAARKALVQLVRRAREIASG